MDVLGADALDVLAEGFFEVLAAESLHVCVEGFSEEGVATEEDVGVGEGVGDLWVMGAMEAVDFGFCEGHDPVAGRVGDLEDLEEGFGEAAEVGDDAGELVGEAGFEAVEELDGC